MELENPVGLDGVEFVEFVGPDIAALQKLFSDFGFTHIANHKTKKLELWRQGDINFILNAEAKGFAAQFKTQHGPSVCSVGFRAKDKKHAYQETLKRGARAFDKNEEKTLLQDLPSIYGIGDSLIYFVDEYKNKKIYDQEFNYISETREFKGKGFLRIDHFTNNVPAGEMQKWCDWYKQIFNFREVRYFDIKGQKTGLVSKVMMAPDDKIIIPINEPSDKKSQIQEYLDVYHGSGIQHIAMLTADIISTVAEVRKSGVGFLEVPNTYYEMLPDRLPQVSEPLFRLQDLKILADGDDEGYLLQIFTQNIIGPIFFEVIQRKNHMGFGEGNFQALFDAIERDQEKTWRDLMSTAKIFPALLTKMSAGDAMSLALEVASLGLGHVEPNPAVGCVILNSNYQLLAYAHHQKYGGPHAEPNAVNQLSKEQLKDALVFVSLEPCAHFGKTPPCANLLVESKSKKVFFALKDPNPKVNGGGIQILQNAGIECEHMHTFTEQAENLNAAFLYNMRKHESFVALKIASSIDSVIALQNGESKWITGELARQKGQALRAQFAALAVGARTFQLDNPKLNIRLAGQAERSNFLLVFNSSLNLLADIKKSAAYACRKPEQIFLCADSKKVQISKQWNKKNEFHYIDQDSGVQILILNSDLEQKFLSYLYELGIYSILVEGGPSLYSYFLRKSWVRKIYHFESLRILGGKDALLWSSALTTQALDKGISMQLLTYESFGQDSLREFKLL